ncbi:MAG: DUF624 domain-containing protein [Anaerolineaceae bacterium]|nr:DUF624 domain-containing protein [Anaerolineaceae bacterium]
MNKDQLKASFGRFMYGMSDLMILNLLVLFCSLPILTIGPVLCALYSVTLKLARNEAADILRDFFSAFKNNFKNGFILGLIAFFAAVVIFADGVYAFSIEGAAKIFFCIITGIVGAVWLTYVSYVFALQARYENSVIGQIKNAFKLAFISPVQTILLWIILAIPVLLILFLPRNVIASIGFLYIMFGVSVPVYCCSKILRGIFARFNPETEEEAEIEE